MYSNKEQPQTSASFCTELYIANGAQSKLYIIIMCRGRSGTQIVCNMSTEHECKY